MTYPSRKKLTEYPIVTPTLADSAVSIQGNTVKRSTLQSIFNLFSANLPPVPPPVPGNLPYKSYVAIVTQSGLTSIFTVSSGIITPGRTYQITANAGLAANFINVGAANNNVGTYFVATGTTPTSWGTNGTLSWDNATPRVIVLENTIGTIWWTYNSLGNFSINSFGKFSIPVTWFNSVILLGDNGPTNRGIITNPGDSNVLTVKTESSAGVPASGILYFTPIEIRVYD